MISQKARKVRNLAFLIIGISIVALIVSNTMWNSCGVRHVTLLNDIETFERTLDPEFCADTVDKILEFNEQCDDSIEILDCG